MNAQKELRNVDEIIGVLLCGGSSRRMGRDKSQLMLRGKSFFRHCCDRFSNHFSRWVAVGAYGSTPLEMDLKGNWLTDSNPGRGPIEGLLTGLRWARQLEPTSWVFVSTVDVPLVVPAISGRMRELAKPDDWCIVPIDAMGVRFGLTAIYRASLAIRLEDAVIGGLRRISDISKLAPSQSVSLELFRDLDSELLSFSKTDTWEDYEAFMRKNERSDEMS